MEPSELLVALAEKLDDLGVRYFVTGSMATIAYGEPRYTNDIDVVVQLQQKEVVTFCQSFPAPEYYVSEQAVRSAVQSYRPFNVILPKAGLKVDFMVAENSPFNKARFERRRQIQVSEAAVVWFGSREDVILKKMDYYQQGGSEKHVRDILGVLKVQTEPIDLEYIEAWIGKLQLGDVWKTVQEELNSET